MSKKVDKDDKLIKIAHKNYLYLHNMIKFFVTSSGKNKIFVDMMENLKLAKTVAGDFIICEYSSKYFLLFKDDILERNVEKLYNFDYTTLIVEGTENKTDILIRKIIDGIKIIWENGDQKVKSEIERYILNILKQSIEFSLLI